MCNFQNLRFQFAFIYLRLSEIFLHNPQQFVFFLTSSNGSPESLVLTLLRKLSSNLFSVLDLSSVFKSKCGCNHFSCLNFLSVFLFLLFLHLSTKVFLSFYIVCKKYFSQSNRKSISLDPYNYMPKTFSSGQ